MIFVQESPIWLLLHNRESLAKQCLMKLRGANTETPEIIQEFTEMQNDSRHKCTEAEMQSNSLEPASGARSPEKAKSVSIWRRIQNLWRELLLPEVWKPFAILNVLFFLQHFCGINVIVGYAVNFVEKCGISAEVDLRPF